MDPAGPRALLLCFPELNQSCPRPLLSPSQALLRLAVLCTVPPLTVLLNLLVVLAVAHFRQLHTPTNLLLLSLAVSDLLVGLVLMPGEVLRESTCWLLGERMCAVYMYVAYVSVSASVIDMVLISVDRYMSICDPLHYSRRVTLRRVSVAVACAWLFSLLYTALILKDNLLYPQRMRTCVGECMFVFDFLSAAVDVFIMFILPVGSILIINLVVLVVAMSQARAMRSQVRAHWPQGAVRRPQRKAARSLGALVGIFLVCFTPYQCISLVGGNVLQSPFATFLVFLVYVNSCLNPLVYAFFYPWFRRAVRLIITLRILKADSCQANMN